MKTKDRSSELNNNDFQPLFLGGESLKITLFLQFAIKSDKERTSFFFFRENDMNKKLDIFLVNNPNFLTC